MGERECLNCKRPASERCDLHVEGKTFEEVLLCAECYEVFRTEDGVTVEPTTD